MILDLRVYTYVPSAYRRFLAGYEKTGFALTSKHLGTTLGIFRPESGLQNRTFQFFMYADSPHRDACRRRMLADPDWSAFVKIDADALREQHNTLLHPTAFSPRQDDAAPIPPEEGAPTRLFEWREWMFRPEQEEAALDLLAAGAVSIDRHAGQVFGWFRPSTGAMHRVYQLAAYSDALDRDERRARAAADPETVAIERELSRCAVAQARQLLLPMPYSPTR